MTLALVSGGSGFVGRFIVERLLGEGVAIRVSGRTPPPQGYFTRDVEFVRQSLDPESDFDTALQGVYHFVHAAFDHLPGRYRGGEGDDAEGFRRRNHLGTMALFRAAKKCGVRRAVFLSSRAVYGAQPAGAILTEKTEPSPDTLYGEVKLATEHDTLAMADEGFEPVVLRITGVYGPAGKGRRHKWADLFDNWRSGGSVVPRAGTEVHGDDVAAAIALVLSTAERVSGEVFDVSDILVDRRDLLEIAAGATAISHPLPPRADPASLHVMSSEKLRALGWRPGGQTKLHDFVRASLTSSS